MSLFSQEAMVYVFLSINNSQLMSQCNAPYFYRVYMISQNRNILMKAERI